MSEGRDLMRDADLANAINGKTITHVSATQSKYEGFNSIELTFDDGSTVEFMPTVYEDIFVVAR